MNRLELEKRIRHECGKLLKEKGYISSVDLLMGLKYLEKSDYEDWRRGKIPFLEKVCQVNLGKLNYINKTLRQVVREKELKASWTAYTKWGKGLKIPLQFSKSNAQTIEKRYSTHYVNRKVGKDA